MTRRASSGWPHRLRSSQLRSGDSLLIDRRVHFAYERVPKLDVEELVLEEVPDIDYSVIGGLGTQIEAIRDAVELPFLHKELFAEHELKAPKGILLYGPPGCGKTLIAKAVANSLAKKVTERTGEEGRSFFLNIKGPELLNKYVGETERHIRLVFQRARDKASDGMPVIVFFDEMDSLFRTRGSGVSSDVENTIVPQLLSEIDGVEGLDNVIIIGASNREDMIDPAILRPGRLDVKIKIERPDAEAAREIFSKYLTPDPSPARARIWPSSTRIARRTVQGMIDRTVLRMYEESEENQFLEVTYAGGDKEVLYFKDFNSGAMIQNIVDRAKKMAIKDLLDTGVTGPADRPPAAGLPGRVRRERGPAQHHQPRRLGQDQRQEGRADRLHPDPDQLQAGHSARPVDRHGLEHRPVPVSCVRARAVSRAPGASVGRRASVADQLERRAPPADQGTPASRARRIPATMRHRTTGWTPPAGDQAQQPCRRATVRRARRNAGSPARSGGARCGPTIMPGDGSDQERPGRAAATPEQVVGFAVAAASDDREDEDRRSRRRRSRARPAWRPHYAEAMADRG